MRKLSYMGCSLLLFLQSYVLYASVESNFNDGLQTGSAYQKEAFKALNQFDPNKTFKNYTDQPPESHYYQDSTETDSPLKEDAVKAAPNNEIAQSLQMSFETRPLFTVDPDAEELKKSRLIQTNAVDIVNGVSNEFVDCNQPKTCTTTYETKTCQETPETITHYCKKTLIVDMVPHETAMHYVLNMHLSASNHDYAGAVVDTVTGRVNFKGPSEANLTFNGSLPSNLACQSLTGTYTVTGSNHQTIIDKIELPNCANNLNLTLHITGHKDKASLNVQIDMVSTAIDYEPKDHWDNDCLALSTNSQCVLQDSHCLEANTTHTLESIPITRACWEYEESYLCRGNTTTNVCQPLRAQGCEQTGSVCEKQGNGGCELYTQTFRCPQKTCTDNGAICNGDTYCLTEDCLEHTKTADPDFQKAVSGLSAINAASNDFDQQYIFTGEAKTCHSDIVNFANCCADSGWGIDMNLSQCDDEEKALGQAKENKQTIYVGSYCDTDVVGVCLAHRKAYCVFPSLLDRIIQEQGRGSQLKIPYGRPEHPNCRGITPEELQAINFDLIDFSDYYADIANKEQVTDPAIVNERIKNDINNSVHGGAL